MVLKFLVNTYFDGCILNTFVDRSNSIDDVLVYSKSVLIDIVKSKHLDKEKLDIYIYDIFRNLVFYYIFVDYHFYYISLK